MLKSDLFDNETIEKYIDSVQSTQDLLTSLSVDGNCDMPEIILENLNNLVRLKNDLADLKSNLGGNCVVWQEPKTTIDNSSKKIESCQ